MIIDVYTDGSVNKEGTIASWAYIIVNGDNIIHEEGGILEGDILSMRQIGGELKAIMKGVCFCRRNGWKARIYHDYNGAYHWVSDIYGDTPWQTKNLWTKMYREWILNNVEHIHEFILVKGHSGVKFNEVVDKNAAKILKSYAKEKK